MTDAFWPGSHRCGDLMSSARFIRAAVEIEAAWLEALVEYHVAPAEARVSARELSALISAGDEERCVRSAESGGNIVIPLVSLLRERLRPQRPEAARWLHRGMTSQDVIDTALMMCAQEVLVQVEQHLTRQIEAVSALAREHRVTPMLGRTLTQHAAPITFGVKVAGWLNSLLDAAEMVQQARQDAVAQFGGAVGTLAALGELAADASHESPRSLEVARSAAQRLGLSFVMPWHTNRTRMTRLGAALGTCVDVWGRIGTDVATLSRSDIAELQEGATGGSSTMPNKANPVLSVLLRRAAIRAPGLVSTLHLASSLTVDERPDGAWHVEWAAVRDLAQVTVIAAGQAEGLVTGLRVNTVRMQENLQGAGESVYAERRSMNETAGHQQPVDQTYLGCSEAIVTAAVDRAQNWTEKETT